MPATLPCVNALWPRDYIWRHKSGSTLTQILACCLATPSHYLNQYWLIIKGLLRHSSGINITRSANLMRNMYSEIIFFILFIYSFVYLIFVWVFLKLLPHLPGVNEDTIHNHGRFRRLAPHGLMTVDSNVPVDTMGINCTRLVQMDMLSRHLFVCKSRKGGKKKRIRWESAYFHPCVGLLFVSRYAKNICIYFCLSTFKWCVPRIVILLCGRQGPVHFMYPMSSCGRSVDVWYQDISIHDIDVVLQNTPTSSPFMIWSYEIISWLKKWIMIYVFIVNWIQICL